MSTFRTAAYAELRKALASRVMVTITLLMLVGVAILATTLVLGVQADNEQVIGQLRPLAQTTGWQLLTGITAQITAAGALLAFGVALSWLFGREFTDGTIDGLFALPVTRPTIALAKLWVYLLWTGAVAVGLSTVIFVCGLTLGLEPVNLSVVDSLTRQLVLIVLTGMLAMPAGLAATLGRGLLPGIAVTVVLLITAQVTVIALPEVAGWVPLAAPALWVMQPAAVTGTQLGAVMTVPLVFAGLTMLAWHRLQLDR